MIRNLTRLTKISNLNLATINTKFSQVKAIEPTIYPFAVGGLKNVQFQKDQFPHYIIDTFFGKDTFVGFQQAYKTLLYSLAKKDIEFFKNNCEQNLYNNIQFKNLKLLNPDAPIQLVCGRYYVAIGAKFNRQICPNLKTLYSALMDQKGKVDVQGMETDLFKNVFITQQLTGPRKKQYMAEVLENGTPVLQGFQILFKSAMKLVNQENINKDDQTNQTIQINKTLQQRQQIHSIQFEVAGLITMTPWQLMKNVLMSKILGRIYFSQKKKKKLFKQVIGDNYEWKIGDIDRILKRNLKVID